MLSWTLLSSFVGGGGRSFPDRLPLKSLLLILKVSAFFISVVLLQARCYRWGIDAGRNSFPSVTVVIGLLVLVLLPATVDGRG